MDLKSGGAGTLKHFFLFVLQRNCFDIFRSMVKIQSVLFSKNII